MGGWQVKLCDPIVTHGPYLSALQINSMFFFIFLWFYDFMVPCGLTLINE